MKHHLNGFFPPNSLFLAGFTLLVLRWGGLDRAAAGSTLPAFPRRQSQLSETSHDLCCQMNALGTPWNAHGPLLLPVIFIKY